MSFSLNRLKHDALLATDMFTKCLLNLIIILFISISYFQHTFSCLKEIPHKDNTNVEVVVRFLIEFLYTKGFTWENVRLSRQIIYAWKKNRDQTSEKHGIIAHSPFEYWEKKHSQGTSKSFNLRGFYWESHKPLQLTPIIGDSVIETLYMKDSPETWKKHSDCLKAAFSRLHIN